MAQGRCCRKRFYRGSYARADKGVLAKSNADQVKLVRKIIEGLGEQAAMPDEAREVLGLKGADKVNF